MKTFKSFIGPVNELETIKLKPKKEQEIVDKTYMAQVKDPGDLEDVGPEEVGPEGVKPGSGKRPADRLDNKQAFGEAESHQSKTTMKHISKPTAGEKKAAKDIKPGIAGYRDRIAMLKSAQARGALKKEEVEIEEADFTKQQTKMAHTIGKEFEKKGVGDKYKGGPYAVATAMVRDKPEAAAKAYKTIKGKMKEQANVDALFNLYNELTEENREIFMLQLEENPEILLDFINNLEESNG
jgi:hypothetical protein